MDGNIEPALIETKLETIFTDDEKIFEMVLSSD